jgi:hypothetical protein
MKRSLIAFFVLFFAFALTAQASISLQVGDVVTYNGRAYDSHSNPLFQGNGGAFSWTVSSVVPSPPSSPVGSTFQSFCDELQQSISTGTSYTVSSVFTPTTGGTINSSGNVLNNMKGIYLFDLWSNGLITQNAANAGAVQVAIWQSEGYTSSAIMSTGGFSSSQYFAASAAISSLLAITDISGSYSSSWTPTDVGAIILKHNGTGAQDQIVLVSTSNNNNNGSVPEPASLVVWGLGASLAAGAAALRRRKQPRGRWSAANRQVILQVIEGKR